MTPAPPPCPADWTLTAIRRHPGDHRHRTRQLTAGHRPAVPVGTYDLSETGPGAGWTASDWVCTGGAATDRHHRHPRPRRQRHLHHHQHRRPAHPDPGQGRRPRHGRRHGLPGDWTLTAIGPDHRRHRSRQQPGRSPTSRSRSGTYDLSETGPARLATDVRLGLHRRRRQHRQPPSPCELGGDATCTITNTADQPDPDPGQGWSTTATPAPPPPPPTGP